MAASPLLVEGKVVVQVDHWGGSYLQAFDAASGKDAWRTMRTATVNWTSPVAMRVAGATQIVTAGTHALRGYSAETGQELWAIDNVLHMQCIPTPVVRGDRFFVGCGRGFTSLAVRPGRDRAEVLWKVPARGLNVPSPVCDGGYYFYAEDAGFVCCLGAATGERLWRGRLPGRAQASPVAADGKLYFACTNGVVAVLQAGPAYKLLARNDLGEPIVASPAVADGALFLRGEKHLFRVGGK
jgi:outer membrane protein assembly factor BamB